MSTPDIMPSREVWAADFTKFAEALKPYVIVIDDATYIEGAPNSLSDPYRDLMSMGYAKGWIK